MSAATTEWTTVKQRKMWTPPITSSRLRREDATHPYLPSRQQETSTKKKAPEFPALPGVKPAASAAAGAGTGLNFKEMARDSAARFEREEAFRLAEKERMAREVSQAEIDRRRLLSRIPTRCYDDGPSDDYDPPEDDEYDEEYNYNENNYEQRGYDGGEDEETEDTTEENTVGYSYYAAQGMRRGQNEFW